mgnify:CR=1 FL=1
MGLSRESLYRILSGNPTLDNIVKLANALGVSVSRQSIKFRIWETQRSTIQDYVGHLETYPVTDIIPVDSCTLMPFYFRIEERRR